MKKTILTFICILLGLSGYSQVATYSKSVFEEKPAPVSDKISEISLLGGIGISDVSKDYFGQNIDYGNSGFSIGVTGLTYLTPYLAAGVDFTYSNNGYGNIITAGPLKHYEVRTEHYTPLVYFKINPFFKSPVRLYIPLGFGMDFVSFTQRQLNSGQYKDTQPGIALMGGLGLEVDLGGGTFAGLEGRYTYTNFLGKEKYDVNHTGNYGILFKLGIRFDNNFLM